MGRALQNGVEVTVTDGRPVQSEDWLPFASGTSRSSARIPFESPPSSGACPDRVLPRAAGLQAAPVGWGGVKSALNFLIPTLVVWGKYDPLFTVAGALAFAREVPEAEVHLLHAGHIALDEEGELIAMLMQRFLARHR